MLVLALSMAALVIVPATALGVAGVFTQPPTSPEAVGSYPISVAAANVNGDANTDLAVANQDSDNVTLLLGDGSGNFTAAGTSPEAAGDLPRSIAAAQLGGDASIDLAVANAGSASVTILLGDGSGNFTAAGTSPEAVGLAPGSVAAANLGGDASTDLAVANRGSDNVTILLGDGSGNFTAAGTSPEAAGDEPISIAAANLGGDASTDLAVANWDSDDVTILLGDGSGNFTASVSSPEAVGTQPVSIAAAKLDGDADTDLAVASEYPNSDDVTILLGDGAGDFTTDGISLENAGSQPTSIVAATLNGDANTDLAVATWNSQNVRLLAGDGSGNFTAAGTSSPTVGSYPVSVAAANLGGNANTDLAVANGNSNNVTILLNDFTPPPPPPVGPTHAGYIAQVDPICQSFVGPVGDAASSFGRNLKRLFRVAESGTLKAFVKQNSRTARSLKRLAQIQTSLTSQIGAVPVPAVDAGTVAAWLEHRRQADSFASRAASALKKLNAKRFFRLLDRALKAEAAGFEAISGFGFQFCG